jgi:hypothetical protein
LADVKCRIASSRRRANETLATEQIASLVDVDLFMSTSIARPSAAEYAIVTMSTGIVRRLEISGSNPKTGDLEQKIECIEKI